MEQCAPDVIFDKNLGTCFNKSNVLDLVKSYNKLNKNNIIDLNNSKDNLYEILKQRMQKKCNDDACIIDSKEFLVEKSVKNRLKPKKPKGKYTWLSTTDINDVMYQYENKYNDFKYLGTVPMDFVEIYDYLKNFDLKYFLSNGKRRFGIVFNLDKSHQSGSHWVSMYMCIKNNKCEINFFDSVSTSPPKEVWDFIEIIYLQSKSINSSTAININQIQHQFKNSECGVYSLNFLISQLDGVNFMKILRNKLDDERMNKHRNIFFRK